MLRDLLQYAYEVTGVKGDNSNTRDQLLRAINRAARELYDTSDLPGSLSEKIFAFDTLSGSEKLITLPWFVGSVRKVRLYEVGPPVALVSIGQKYAPRVWQPPFLNWRIYHRSPLEKTLAQASTLEFTITEAETTPIEITVTGQTSTAARRVETVTIAPGELSATTTNQWVQDDPDGIVALSKNRITETDVAVTTTVDGERVATLHNRALEARNIVIQVADDLGDYSAVDNTVEILYKKVFIPFYYDTDSFCAPELEDAIVWKMREHWYSQKAAADSNELMGNAAMLAGQKCAGLIAAACMNIESERERCIIAAPNPYQDAVITHAKRH